MVSDELHNYTKTGVVQSSDDIVTLLRKYQPYSKLHGQAADEIELLQDIVTTVDDLHSPRLAHDTCLACDHNWPCPTHLLIHPEAVRGE